MKKIFKLKYLAHHFINYIFYIIVFLLGFFLGYYGKKYFIQQVLALEPTINMPAWNYSNNANFDFYEDNDLFKKVDLLIDRYYKIHDKEKFGISVMFLMNFKDASRQEILTNGGVFQSKIQIVIYEKEYLIDWNTSVTGLTKYGKISAQMGRPLVASRYYMNGLSFSGTSNVIYSYTLNYSTTSVLWTGSINDVADQVNNGIYDSYFKFSNGGINGTIDIAPYTTNDFSSTDILYYYSDVEIEARYTTSNPFSYKFDDLIIDQGDKISFLHQWREENEIPSVTDDLFYVCTDKPFFLSSKQGTLSAAAVTDTFSSTIYLDYDLPPNLYPFLFNFNSEDLSNNITIPLSLIDYSMFGFIGIRPPGTDGLIGVPFTINNPNNIVFSGFSPTWHLYWKNDEHTIIDFHELKNLSNWTINTTDKYFYDYMVYQGVFNGTFHEWRTRTSSFKNVINDISSTLTGKADYIDFLLRIRNNYDIYNKFCFYYDNDNLTFTYGVFNENGGIDGPVIINGKGIEVSTGGNGGVFNGGSVVNNALSVLSSPIAYLGALIMMIWNALPPVMQVTFVSVASIGFIFMILRMVGYNG